MLTLTRPNAESMRIITEDNKVTQIRITGINGEQVKITFKAPALHRIIRKALIQFSNYKKTTTRAELEVDDQNLL